MDRERNGTQRRARRKKQPDPEQAEGDRLPPHDDDAEQGVLGCILLSPACITECQRALANSGAFYSEVNRIVYDKLVSMSARNQAIDLITIQSAMRDDGELDQVGGLAFLSSLPDRVPSAANVGHYLDIVREKAALRLAINTCADIIARAYDHQGELDELLEGIQRDLGRLREAPDRIVGPVKRFDQLCAFDTAHDANTLLGVRADGTTSRYLCRGGSGWIIGPSGIGKSSLAMTMAILWSAGMPAWGITPSRPLRVTVIQAENDEGDMAEMAKGLADGMKWDEFNGEQQRELVHENFKVRTEVVRTGREFTLWLEQVIKEDRADIVLLDPFLSFGGFDVSKQEQCSQFLRSWLNPVLQRTGAAVLGMHHTGKPKADRRTKGMRPLTPLEQAYDGLGSSELVNWARLVQNLSEAGDGVYRLTLTKRANRAGATHPSGEPTAVIWLQQGKGRIWWQQIDPPAPSEEEKPKEKRKTKPEIVATMNTHSFITGCDTDGESLRSITKRLANWSMSKAAPTKVDLSPTTARAAVVMMVEAGKLESRDGLYFKGESA